MVRSSAALALAALSALAAAKTDIGGCTYYDGVFTPSHGYPYATRIWYVDGTGELCEILDCGGGRAPPKTTVPGCDNYVGTATYEPRFIDPATLGDEPITTDIVGTVRGASVTTSEAVASETTSSESAAETGDDAEDTAGITDVSTTAAPETGSRSETTPAATQTSSSAEETETGAPDSAAGVVGAKLGVAALGAFVAAAAGFL